MPVTGAFLRDLRMFHGVRQAAVARAMGVTRQSVWRIERRRRPVTEGCRRRYLSALYDAWLEGCQLVRLAGAERFPSVEAWRRARLLERQKREGGSL